MRDFMRPGRSVAVAENARAATSHPAALAALAMHGVVDPHMTEIALGY